MIQTSQQVNPAQQASTTGTLIQDQQTIDPTQFSEVLSAHNFPATERMNLETLSDQVRACKIEAAKILAAALLTVPVLAIGGTYIYKGLAEASTAITALPYLALFTAFIWMGKRGLDMLCDKLDRCLAPCKVLEEAKNNGSICAGCEYPVYNTESSKCPECGSSIESHIKT